RPRLARSRQRNAPESEDARTLATRLLPRSEARRLHGVGSREAAVPYAHAWVQSGADVSDADDDPLALSGRDAHARGLRMAEKDNPNAARMADTRARSLLESECSLALVVDDEPFEVREPRPRGLHVRERPSDDVADGRLLRARSDFDRPKRFAKSGFGSAYL